MGDLVDYWNWWKTRRSQIGALIMLAGLIVWMNVAFLEAERNYRGVLREMRRTYTQQEATRERQFTRMLTVLETHLARLNVETAEELKQQEVIREMFDTIVKSAVKPARDQTATPARQQQ